MSINARIKYLRKINKLTQDNLASKINVSRGNVSDWERGRAKPGADALTAISSYFQVSTDWLLTGEGRGPGDIADKKESNLNFTITVPSQAGKIEALLPKNQSDSQFISGASMKRILRSCIDEMYQQIGRVNRETDEEVFKEQNVIYLAEKIENYLEQKSPQDLTMESLAQQILGELTEEEIKLIQGFRQLPERVKGKIEGIIEASVAQNDPKRGELSDYHSGEEAATKELA